MSLARVQIGPDAPKLVNVVIEIPHGTNLKYEYDEKLDCIRLDRVLHSAVYYPAEYGFIPETRAEDGDHLDVLVIISEPLFPGCVLTVRPIGALEMSDEHGKDHKIIAVASHDPRFEDTKTLADLGPHKKKEIKNFFEIYKQLEEKAVEIGEWLDQEQAYAVIREGVERYKK